MWIYIIVIIVPMLPNCDRCQKPRGRFLPSMFNNQMVCRECKLTETKHPQYREAEKQYIKEATRGNPKFPGIGLPSDLLIIK